MGVLRVIKGEDLIKEIINNAKINTDEGILTFKTLYNSLIKELKGKRILID